LEPSGIECGLSTVSQGKSSAIALAPYAEEGNFCKHCVALEIAFLKGEDEILSSSHPAELDAVRAYLQQCPHEELVDLLLEQAT